MLVEKNLCSCECGLMSMLSSINWAPANPWTPTQVGFRFWCPSVQHNFAQETKLSRHSSTVWTVKPGQVDGLSACDVISACAANLHPTVCIVEQTLLLNPIPIHMFGWWVAGKSRHHKQGNQANH